MLCRGLLKSQVTLDILEALIPSRPPPLCLLPCVQPKVYVQGSKADTTDSSPTITLAIGGFIFAMVAVGAGLIVNSEPTGERAWACGGGWAGGRVGAAGCNGCQAGAGGQLQVRIRLQRSPADASSPSS